MASEHRTLIYFDELVMALARTYRDTMDTHIYSPRDIMSSMQGLRPVDAVEVEDKELLKAIKILIKQYEHSKNSDYVHSPVAHAFYHTWKQLDERRE